MKTRFRFVRRAPRACWFVWPLLLLLAPLGARADALRALVVGGGPNPQNNQAAIESNVHYLLRLLPREAACTVHFADGDPKHATVVFEAETKEAPAGERVLALLLQRRGMAPQTVLRFRAPSLPRLDGAAKKAEVAASFERLRAENGTPDRPLLLYFTGHGSKARDGNLHNNVFDLWDGALSVREMAAHLARVPARQPVTLVMVQCFAGSFGNLLFGDGDPQGALLDRDIAGFFAATPDRMAAGCTPAIDEAEYHDFSSYFFAALTGRDRVGRPVTGADYSRDGRVGMDEAFAYTLIHDASIDVPVCTSDVFLRRVVSTPEAEVFRTPYSQVTAWASPAQRAALEALSRSLKLSGEDRGEVAYRRFRGVDPSQGRENPLRAAYRRFTRAREEARRPLLARWPDLYDEASSGYAAARKEALALVERQIKQGKLKELLDAKRLFDAAREARYQKELADARQLRFVRLFKSVVLAHTLRESGDAAMKRRLERLLAAESRTLLPPAEKTPSKDA
jgi:hypothetical protein